jgi:dipeptidyl aminopeptidase/acylaminoacyl peptidase
MDMTEIREVSWVGDECLRQPLRGVVLVFHGLGHTGTKQGPSTEELAWGAAGGLVVFPYYGPWSWMNRAARAFVDDLVDSVWQQFSVPADAPLICTGGSMGGGSSLLYTRYARRKVAGCLANCPVCDMAFHFNERPDLPKTFRHAFRGYGEGMDAALAEHSPLRQAGQMPDIPYLLLHGGKDQAVNKQRHSDAFVAAMRAAGRTNVEYVEVPDMGHCGPMPIDVLQRTIDFVSDILNGGTTRDR